MPPPHATPPRSPRSPAARPSRAPSAPWPTPARALARPSPAPQPRRWVSLVVEEPPVQRTFHRYRCPARLPACVGDHQPQRGQPQYPGLQPAEGQLRYR
ncbi:hypothetical protein G6F60_015577 [Rhizopus arrhizus]|nr:hypothetical protein G6F60_015577 [Rhizopus arrhizus]